MPGRVAGKVAFITGAARGQGRAHAIRLAQEGADIIAVDACQDIETVPYKGATEADLQETVKQVEALDRRIVAAKADVRNYQELKAALDDGVAQLGRLDIVCANAGIFSNSPVATMPEEQWDTMIDVNLSGVFRTCKAAIPHLVQQAQGSIIITSSVAGLKGGPMFAHYVSAKHGLVGLMRSLALELASKNIRVNCVNPGNVNTDMVHNDILYKLFLPDVDHPTKEQFAERLSGNRLMLPAPWAEPEDISNAVLFLASDESRFITGVALPVDLGAMAQ